MPKTCRRQCWRSETKRAGFVLPVRRAGKRSFWHGNETGRGAGEAGSTHGDGDRGPEAPLLAPAGVHGLRSSCHAPDRTSMGYAEALAKVQPRQVIPPSRQLMPGRTRDWLGSSGHCRLWSEAGWPL